MRSGGGLHTAPGGSYVNRKNRVFSSFFCDKVGKRLFKKIKKNAKKAVLI